MCDQGRRTLPRWVSIAALIVCAPLLLLIEYGPPISHDPVLAPMMQMALTRALAAAVFFVLLLTLGYRVLNPMRPPFWRSLVFALPAFAVVINNLPILALLTGRAWVVHNTPLHYLVFAAESLAIGLFEEIAFRGVILLRFAERRRDNHRQLLLSILLTSAVFGGMHLINLAAGASLPATLLQIGYSFLIGAMCSAVLLKTGNLWLCVILHAVYDFCGSLVPTLGAGSLWDTPTVIITAVLGVAVAVFYVVMFFRMDVGEMGRIY